jgi:transposase-like protein
MAAAKSRATRRRWPAAEKRRIVELTLCAGASLSEIAREHAVHPNTVYHWRRVYRAGKLDAQSPPALRRGGKEASALFVPVRVVAPVPQLQQAAQDDSKACCGGVVQLMLASGGTLRIESAKIDTALVCALVAELRR